MPAPRDPGLNGRPRQRLIAQVRAEEPNCHICQQPIDLARDKQTDPLGSVVDEVIPRSLGGSPADRANVRHAHRLCNGIRGVQDITPPLRLACRRAVEARQGQRHTRQW